MTLRRRSMSTAGLKMSLAVVRMSLVRLKERLLVDSKSHLLERL